MASAVVGALISCMKYFYVIYDFLYNFLPDMFYKDLNFVVFLIILKVTVVDA